MQTLAQEARAIQSFEDARLAEYLDRKAEEEAELRLCGECGRATPIDGSDVFTVLKRLPNKTCSESTRRALDKALRGCAWCEEAHGMVGDDWEACPEWIHYADCEE